MLDFIIKQQLLIVGDLDIAHLQKVINQMLYKFDRMLFCLILIEKSEL